MLRVKGSVLKTRLGFVEDLRPGAAQEVLATLAPEDQAALTGILATKWYPFALGRRLDEAIVHAVGGGRPQFFERLGEASAEKNLSGVHKDFLTVGDPHAFLAKAPVIYSFYYDQGRREYEKAGPKEAILVTRDAPSFSVADCLTVVGWHRRALEMCGATGVSVVEEECRAKEGAVCRYRLRWS